MPTKQKISTLPKRTTHKQLAPKKISLLGRKLIAIRRDIEQSGLPLLSDEEIAQERYERHGETSLN